ncbi:FAD/NAD(P)-binding domain-containing protein [Rhizodiscina lignyota]|uniref:FAD/NAD(P)-binding domain-containing protein n=1 Tax=Rhizodiscina lignyota TaxID=1504668 RepID=A0A9P4I849_9PEZI|nr:FAD/NAD(P)-binding domain-containing protein [Rhizodiscina lignyota]
MSLNARKPILISGAGICALLFAQTLRRASIPFIIFERDSSISFRAQGYRLRLSEEGLSAIESALGPEAWPKFWATCSKTGGTAGGFAAIDALTGEEVSGPLQNGVRINDREGRGQPLALISRDGKVVGIARGEMRKLFMEGCEPFVQWSHQVTSYELTPSGVRAVFADGSKSVEGEMLVGGEGISSKIAKQLSQGKIKVYDMGSRGIHGQAPTTAFKGLGEGVWRMMDDTNPDGKVYAMTNVRPNDMDDPNVMFGWTMSAQPGVIEPPNNDYTIVGVAAAKIAKELTKNWHPRIKPLFDQMNESEAAFWKITCSSPIGVPEWPNEPRVTLIGDAVHGMTPAGGNGANTAVRDSALLGRLLAEAGGYADGVTAAYEKEMKVYATEQVKASYGMASGSFGATIDENTPTV